MIEGGGSPAVTGILRARGISCSPVRASRSDRQSMTYRSQGGFNLAARQKTLRFGFFGLCGAVPVKNPVKSAEKR